MTITEVSHKYDLTADTLRYYERVGLLPSVQRGSNGHRDFNEEDCRWVHFIKCMRGAGVPVEVLIEYVRLFQQGDATKDTRKQLLIQERERMAQRIAAMEQTLQRLDYKIDRYEERVVPKERQLLWGEEPLNRNH